MNSPFMMVLYSLLGGFAAMTLLGFALHKLLARTVPEWAGMRAHSTPGAVLVNLGFAFLAGAAGGYIAGWIGGNPVAGVLGLAAMALLMGAISVVERRRRQPLWFQVLMLVLSLAGVLVGGLVRVKLMGVKWVGFEW